MPTRPQSDLVIAANRLPVHRSSPEHGWETSPGGLVSALLPILRRDRGVWVGWGGSTGSVIDPFEHDGFACAPVELSERELEEYYAGFSNRTLWPLYHDACQQPEFRRRWWHTYVEINRRFAHAISESAAPGAKVLVQDYHLQLVPGMLRELRSDVRIGFFLHIPFPPTELFAQLPWRSRILEGLLGADVVGFQTRSGAQNFQRLVGRYTGHRPQGGAVRIGDRWVQARAFPISIDVKRFEELAARPEIRARAQEIRRDLGEDRTILLGVDRLDYTKGIDIRLRALQDLLASGRRTVDDIVMVQISVPSRELVEDYVDLRSRVEELVGKINGNHAKVGRIPVHYLRRSLPIEELVPHYVAADVMVVTPLRDGMNLVAKEYVACRRENTGVLVLSEFAGAARELRDALLVNPHDIDGMSEAFARAAEMPPEQQQRRMRAMRRRIRRRTVYDWVDEFMGAVEESSASRAAGSHA
ncbi:MAG: trehalose-6-phosphate synthase [Phycisphaerales bacterium JB037]